jgi:hypothetical protein
MLERLLSKTPRRGSKHAEEAQDEILALKRCIIRLNGK